MDVQSVHQIHFDIIMEMVKIPKDEYERMKAQIAMLKELEKIDFNCSKWVLYPVACYDLVSSHFEA